MSRSWDQHLPPMVLPALNDAVARSSDLVAGVTQPFLPTPCDHSVNADPLETYSRLPFFATACSASNLTQGADSFTHVESRARFDARVTLQSFSHAILKAILGREHHWRESTTLIGICGTAMAHWQVC